MGFACPHPWSGTMCMPTSSVLGGLFSHLHIRRMYQSPGFLPIWQVRDAICSDLHFSYLRNPACMFQGHFVRVWELWSARFLLGCWSFSLCFLGALYRFGESDLCDQGAQKLPQAVPSVLTEGVSCWCFWGKDTGRFVFFIELSLFMFSSMASGFHR